MIELPLLRFPSAEALLRITRLSVSPRKELPRGPADMKGAREQAHGALSGCPRPPELTTAGQKGYFWCFSQTSIPTSNERGSGIKDKDMNSKSHPQHSLHATNKKHRRSLLRPDAQSLVRDPHGRKAVSRQRWRLSVGDTRAAERGHARVNSVPPWPLLYHRK